MVQIEKQKNEELEQPEVSVKRLVFKPDSEHLCDETTLASALIDFILEQNHKAGNLDSSPDNWLYGVTNGKTLVHADGSLEKPAYLAMSNETDLLRQSKEKDSSKNENAKSWMGSFKKAKKTRQEKTLFTRIVNGEQSVGIAIYDKSQLAPLVRPKPMLHDQKPSSTLMRHKDWPDNPSASPTDALVALIEVRIPE